MTTFTQESLLDSQEVADRTRTPLQTIRYWRHVGLGPRSFKVGRRVLYRREDVESWLQKQYDADPSQKAEGPSL